MRDMAFACLMRGKKKKKKVSLASTLTFDCMKHIPSVVRAGRVPLNTIVTIFGASWITASKNEQSVCVCILEGHKNVTYSHDV